MRKLIKKILVESDWDWIENVKYVTLEWGEIPKKGEKLICVDGYINTEELSYYIQGADEDVCDKLNGGHGYYPKKEIIVEKTTLDECTNGGSRVIVWPRVTRRMRNENGIMGDALARISTQHKTINESYFDSNKLYNKSYIDSVTKNADRNIKRIVNNLEVVKCKDKNNNSTECVRIPEVVFVYINGRY